MVIDNNCNSSRQHWALASPNFKASTPRNLALNIQCACYLARSSWTPVHTILEHLGMYLHFWEFSHFFTLFRWIIQEYELLRLKTHRSIFEKWREIKCELLNSDSIHADLFQELYYTMREHHIELMAHMNRLRQNDGLDRFRIDSAKILSDLVQKKIDQIQNPPNCQQAFLINFEMIWLPQPYNLD